MSELDENRIDEIEQYIVNRIRKLKVPGLSIGIIKNKEVVYANGFGARDIDKNLPMTQDTLFGIGSISKSITALAIMQLVEQGKIKLSDPASKYMPFKLGDDANPITIHHLLSHTSGVPELDGANYSLDRVVKATDVLLPMSSRTDFLAHLNGAGDEIKFEPGEKFFYNNDMFTCLALIIEAITKTRLPDYVQKHVFEPLEMKRATYTREGFEGDPEKNTSTFYLMSEEDAVEVAPFPYSELLDGPGAILCSVSELLKYMQALLNGGRYKGREIIKPSSLERLWTPNIKTNSDRVSYCYAWSEEKDFLGQRIIQHGGSVCVSSGYFMFSPDQGTGVVVGSNCGHAQVGSIARAVFALVSGEAIEEALPELKAQRRVEPILGEYESYKGINRLEVELQRGVLTATLSNDGGVNTFPLMAKNLDELKFYIASLTPNKDFVVQFYVDEDEGDVYSTFERYVFHKI
jgi:CubicO group peptidase (beta-lactamase class C family)